MKKRVLAWILMMAIVFTALQMQVLAVETIEQIEVEETETQSIGTLDYLGRTIETTPRPTDDSVHLFEITEEEADETTQRYENLLAADPQMFLLTEAGIKGLSWTGAPTSKEMAWLKEKAQSITEGCSNENEKIFAIVKYMALNICYDYDYYYGRTTINELNLDPYDVLVGESSICEGYARTAATLLQLVDVPCILVDSPNHKWNIAHDGERWIMLDTTWVAGGELNYGVLEKSDELWLDWYDFTIEEAVANVNHLFEKLPYDIVDGVLSYYPANTKATEAVIPTSVTSIKAIFADDIENMYLPKTVESIGKSAFGSADVENVLYAGTESQYDDISIGSSNRGLTGANFTFLDEASAPFITKHPADQMADPLTAAVLTVEAVATDDTSISYQWYENSVRSAEGGMPIDGATEETLTLSYTEEGEHYYYAEVMGTDMTVSGEQTTSVFSVPAKVIVYPEIPASIIQMGDHVMCHYFENMALIHISGYGPVDASMVKYAYGPDSNCTVQIDAGITDLPEKLLEKHYFEYAKEFVVDEENTAYASDEAGALLDLKKKELVFLPYYSEITEYAIPEGIESVREGAIRSWELQYLSIPASLKKFPGGLGGCHNLTAIYVDSDNTVFYLDEMGAWIDREEQRIIRLPDEHLEYGSTYVIDPEIKIIEDYAFYNCQSLFNVVIPDGVTYIGKSAFVACYNLKGALVLPSALTVIGDSAFEWCDGFSGELVIPEGVQSIGSDAFYGCIGLTGVQLPAGLTELGDYAFTDCTGITGTVVIPEGITVLESYVFSGCTALEEVVLPVGMTEIERGAFSEATALTAITIPETVLTIADDAFETPENVTVYGCAGSYAEEYAAENNMPFVDITCHAESVSLEQGSAIYMLAGTTMRPELIVTPAETTDAITLRSSNTDVVKVLPGRKLEAVDEGTVTITATASSGASCKFTVKVQKVKSLQVTTLPERVRYSTGEELDLAGMVVTATFTDGTSVEVQDYKVTGYRRYQEGTHEIRVSYGGKEDSFIVSVTDPLNGSWGEALSWECLYGTDVSMSGLLPEGCMVYVASYTENGQQIALTVIMDIGETVVIDKEASYLQFFCVDQNMVPQSEKLHVSLQD